MPFSSPSPDSAFDAAVRVAVYSEFVKSSRCPSTTQLAASLTCTSPEIEASLLRLADAHVLVLDEEQRILMAMPFSAVRTAFSVTSANGQWFANCAWDALGIPAALGTDARIDTTCADCGETMSLEIRSKNLVEVTGIIHFAVPAAHWWDDIHFT